MNWKNDSDKLMSEEANEVIYEKALLGCPGVD